MMCESQNISNRLKKSGFELFCKKFIWSWQKAVLKLLLLSSLSQKNNLCKITKTFQMLNNYFKNQH